MTFWVTVILHGARRVSPMTCLAGEHCATWHGLRVGTGWRIAAKTATPDVQARKMPLT